MTAAHFDALVVGGGLAGRAAAIATAKAGLATLHLSPQAAPDRRTSALMRPSVALLEELGVVADPAELGHPLTQIRIIDATRRLVRAPETLFDSRDAGLDAFGWNFANVALAGAFEAVAGGLANLVTWPHAAAAIGASDAGWAVTLDDHRTITTDLLVGADGKQSRVRTAAGIAVRQSDFGEAALVCDLSLGRSLHGQSVEFHYDHGPFTLVPAGGRRANLVWIDARPVLDGALAAGTEQLTATFRARMQGLFGDVTIDGPVQVFPLSMLAVATAGRGGAVLVGEAAHAFPPIGAQGLNLGLRDVADLGAALAAADRRQPGWAKTLSGDYARRRAADLVRTGTMVEALFRSLLADMLPAQAARAGGLWALKLVPGLRKQAFALGMGAR
jgi:2-octaprenyl-6-methoxyphenol hydroxylase